jgi:peptide/nickel transport system permease protein
LAKAICTSLPGKFCRTASPGYGATVSLGFTLLVIAALSFLGLGSPPPTPDWGADLNLARDHMETRPLIAVFPGLATSYAVLAFNLFGDGLRDILDPRLVEK